jgi:thiosulfate/3-mercaptopyruvate sulfurtransferase
MTAAASALATPTWLMERLAAPAPEIAVADASWHLPAAGRDPRAEYAAAHIPGAVFFDIDGISDPDTSLPHMLPAPAAFAAAMERLGIGDQHTVVVYDTVGLYSAPRAWWMLKAMGARDVRVLDGGLPAWRAAGGPVEAGVVERPPATFTARLDPAMIARREDVAAAVAGAADGGTPAVVDARAAERFRGEAAEPRPGLRAGHMPGARNVPFTSLQTPAGTLRPPEELGAAFAAAGVDPARPVITSCGSGVTAAVLSLALHELGRRDVALYDGSWSEWGADPELPIATGP